MARESERHAPVSKLLLAALGLMVGCTDSPTNQGPVAETQAAIREQVTELASRELQEAVNGRRSRGPEDEILRLESAVRGIGGAYLDREKGTLVVFSKYPELDEQAAAGADALIARFGLSREEATGVEVRRGQYEFSELVGWHRVLLTRLANLPGFHAIDTDERANRIRIRVSSEETRLVALHEVQRAGLDVAAVEVTVDEPLRSLASLSSTFRPTAAGVLISLVGSSMECTHGWSVSTNQGEHGFLTASHCVSLGGGSTGASFTQPTSGVVGQVDINNSWNLTTCIDPDTQQFYDNDCTRADAMFIESSEAVKQVALTQDVGTNNDEGSKTVAQLWREIGDVPLPVVGISVDKVGKATGWTRGTLETTCEDQIVVKGSTEYMVLCAYRVEGAAAGEGDSGSPVFKAFSLGDLQPMGILFSGKCDEVEGCAYAFSEWDNIRLHLGRTFDAKPPTPTLSASISGPSSVKPGVVCTWSVVTTGGDSPYAWEWSGVLSGMLSQVEGAISGSGWLRVTVTDDAMGVAEDSLFVSRTSLNPECGGGGGGGPEEVEAPSGRR